MKDDQWTTRVVAATVFMALFTLGMVLCFVTVPDKNHDIVVALTTAFTTSAVGIVAFYFGSSSSSRSKDDTIKNIVEKAP